uniref:J domain-containing protein n=1 Tax=Macrostomum lignano TaxID=282301 RepID=A0A1I8FQY9_9PLAT
HLPEAPPAVQAHRNFPHRPAGARPNLVAGAQALLRHFNQACLAGWCSTSCRPTCRPIRHCHSPIPRRRRNANREESLRCLGIAKTALASGDAKKAERLLRKACRLDAVDGCPEAKRLLEQLLSNSGSHGRATVECAGRRWRCRRRRTSSGSGHPERQFTEEQASGVARIRKAKDYYEILGVAKDATDDDLKRSYRKLALKRPAPRKHLRQLETPIASWPTPPSGSATIYYGSEEEQQATRRHSNGRGYYYDDYSRGFEADVSPEEIFNMFFGGGFPTYEMRQRRPGGINGTTAARLAKRPFAPIFLLMLMSVLSGLMHRDPWYSLSANNAYSDVRHTRHSKVPYYVKPNFRSEFTGNLGQLEAEIEDDFFHTLRVKCYRERSYKESMQFRAKYYHDKEAYAIASKLTTPHCDMLNRARSKVPSPRLRPQPISEPDSRWRPAAGCLFEIGLRPGCLRCGAMMALRCWRRCRLSRSFSQLNWMIELARHQVEAERSTTCGLSRAGDAWTAGLSDQAIGTEAKMLELNTASPGRSYRFDIYRFRVGDSQAEIFLGAKKSINYLISILRLGLKARGGGPATAYSVAEMSNINRLALNDANKDLLVELNVLSVVKLMLDSPEAQDVQEGLEILFTLSFSQRAARAHQDGVQGHIERLHGAVSSSRQLNGLAFRLLGGQRSGGEAASRRAVPSGHDQLQSPASKQQVERLHAACAEYAWKCGKKLIPVLMEPKYKATGWLGMLLGTQLYFDLTESKYPFEEKFSQLLPAIQSCLDAAEAQSPPPQQHRLPTPVPPLPPIAASGTVAAAPSAPTTAAATIPAAAVSDNFEAWDTARVARWCSECGLPHQVADMRLTGARAALPAGRHGSVAGVLSAACWSDTSALTACTTWPPCHGPGGEPAVHQQQPLLRGQGGCPRRPRPPSALRRRCLPWAIVQQCGLRDWTAGC